MKPFLSCVKTSRPAAPKKARSVTAELNEAEAAIDLHRAKQ